MTDRRSDIISPLDRPYLSPTRHGNRSVSGSGVEIASTNSLPLSGTSSVPSAGKKGQMRSLLGEFKGLYESRLKKLDEADKTGEETTKVSRGLCSDSQ